VDRPVLGGGAAAFLGAAFFLAGAFLAGAFFLAWHLLGAVRNATIPFLVVKLQFVILLIQYIYFYFNSFSFSMRKCISFSGMA
jgi:hypothetical protein